MGILFFFQLLSYAEAADYSTHYEYDSLRRLVERYSPAQILIQKTKTDYSLTGQLMWQQLSGQFFKRHSEFAQTPPVTYNY